MANTLPGVPPAFDREDVAGTVKALCVYTRTLQENLDFALGQIKKSILSVQNDVSALQSGIEAAMGGINTIASSYAQLEARVADLEQKNA